MSFLRKNLLQFVLLGIFLTGLGASYFGPHPSHAQVTSGQRTMPLGYQQITLTGTAASLTVPTGAVAAYFYVETAAARYRDDGTAPTTTVGQPIPVNGSLFYSGSLTAIQFIAQTGSPVLNVLYYRIAG